MGTPSADTYRTLSHPGEGYFRDRGSKFLAYAYPIQDEAAATAHIEQLHKDHPKSRHVCYALRLGHTGDLYRANDDGEPGNSAGRPILGQIDRLELTQVLVAVVRYFGGTKLGVPGLINAYKTSAAEALAQAIIVERVVQQHYRLDFTYALMPLVMGAVKQLDATIFRQEFTEAGMLEVGWPASIAPQQLLRLKAQVGQLHLEAVEEQTTVEGLDIEVLDMY